MAFRPARGGGHSPRRRLVELALGAAHYEWPAGTAVLIGALLIADRVLRPMWWPARLFLGTLTVAIVCYLAVVIRVTFAGGMPLLGVLLSTVLLALELAAMALTLAFAFEMADTLGRERSDPVPPRGSESYRPRVCIQVPAYNEPPELLRTTLEALAHLEYEDYAVQVVVNNTTDEALWRPVEQLCRELGRRFHFIHLPEWPGFKAGALNEATCRLDRKVEIVAIVDADYVVARDFLSTCVPFLADQMVAFVQTPQHYREWRDSGYLRGLFHAYRYFFDVSMVSRARTNAASMSFGRNPAFA
ncbi:MAG: glycosyltransferase [Candidatus Dormibacterales bacterium]